jgi:hypothetical protein
MTLSYPHYPLPWTDPVIPSYKEVSIGKWKCTKTPAGDKVTGYWRPHNFVPPGWTFMQKVENNWMLWMSLAPMELESHQPHIAAAKGTVVVAGLGMGFYLYNIIRKPEVTRVIVLEKDKNVVNLWKRTVDVSQWHGFRKVELVMGDAFSYRPDFPVDFLYADIWPYLGYSEALGITQRLQANIQAREVGFWGQEFDFITWTMAQKLPGSVAHNATHANYLAFCEAVGLPLVERHHKRYPKLAFVAVTLQTAISATLDTGQRAILTREALGVLQNVTLITATNESSYGGRNTE